MTVENKHCNVASSQDNRGNGDDDSSLAVEQKKNDADDINHGGASVASTSNARSGIQSSSSSSSSAARSNKNTQRRPPTIPRVTTPRRGTCSASSSDESSDDGDDNEINVPSYHNSRAAPSPRRRRNQHGSSNTDDGTATGDSTATSSSYRHSSGPSHNNNNNNRNSSDNDNNNNNSGGVSPDQERQILLLMLLAQVCALHDPTPRTFTVHVLELFERGILGRQSIHFLFELGLVPSSAPRLLPPSTTGMNSADNNNNNNNAEGGGVLDLATTMTPSSPQSLRTQEASAIRNHLEQHDLAQETANANLLSPQGGFPATSNALTAAASGTATATDSSPTKKKKNSWAVEHHPLSLSRYQREFHQVRLLNAGSFGEVFQANSKIDLKDYAIKRVAFAAYGYSKDSVTQVIREVHCLAKCDHQNVVRYYTSWLEPSWMTGSGATMISSTGNTSADVRHQQKLLTDIQHMMITGGSNNGSSLGGEQSQLQALDNSDSNSNSNSNLQDFFQGQVTSLRNRKFSIGSSLDSLESAGSSYDETSSEEEEERSQQWGGIDDYPTIRSRDDSILFQSHSRKEVWESSSPAPRRCKTQGSNRKQPAPLKYRYQICLFIQMQLCHPATLADWIRNRSSQATNPNEDREERIQTALKIFRQIVSGLEHIHKKNIVHRDLKPANLFRSLEDEGVFLIGDFGLSKLIHRATNHNKQHHSPHAEGSSQTMYYPPAEYPDAASTWQDPLTAGVGTASYAANEQVTTRTYGRPADIFSLGLILLELVCCFGTEHERMQTFNDCRNRREVPSWITNEYPLVASTILACTNPDPVKRPTADELVNLDLLDVPSTTAYSTSSCENNASAPAVEQGEDAAQDPDSVVARLRQELETKNQEIQSSRDRLTEKDQTIEALRQELAQLKAHQPEVVGSQLQYSYVCTNLDVEEVASSSSSSGDGV